MSPLFPLPLFACAFLFAESSEAQAAPAPYREVGADLDSGYRDGRDRESTIYRGRVRVEQATWLRLRFGTTHLPDGSRLRLRAAADGAVQEIEAADLRAASGRSASFNGGEVAVELVAAAHSRANRVSVVAVDAGEVAPIPEGLCGSDDRVLSRDPRIGRQHPTGCTVWLANEFTLVTAGHCLGNTAQAAHFNVPASSPSGQIRMPDPRDQYSYDMATLHKLSGSIGSDWAVLSAVPGSQSGLWPGQAQGAWFGLGTPPAAGTTVRVTGHGVVGPPLPLSWNAVQTTHAARLTGLQPTFLMHVVDTTAGDSGAPVIAPGGEVVGIHTHGGCASGANHATRIDRSDLQNALAIVSSSKVVGKVRAFGAGCSSGPSPPTLAADGFPVLGRSLTLRARDLPAGQIGAMFFGRSDRSWRGRPLPFALPGAPACSVWIAFEVAVGLPTGAGEPRLAIDIPAEPGLVGASVYAQLAHTDPGANPLGVGTTGALELSIGRE